MHRFRTILIVTVLFALLIVAGILAQDEGSSSDELTEEQAAALDLLETRGVPVRPLEEVTESEAQILDLEPTSARLNFVGTIPLGCALLYGETTEFGNLSVSLEMNGGAIIEHNPLLLDLKPDTEYFYRLQGSSEDGTFYIGEIGSFRTPPESDAVSANLLSPERGATVLGVSSNYGGAANDETWGILKAFDDNRNTAWSSDGDGSDAWFEVELAERSHIERIAFETRTMTDGTAQILSFTITTDEGTQVGPFELPDPNDMHEFEVDFEAKTLRFDVESSTGGNTGITEVAVYGEPVEE
jgi:hypothetical protein